MFVIRIQDPSYGTEGMKTGQQDLAAVLKLSRNEGRQKRCSSHHSSHL